MELIEFIRQLLPAFKPFAWTIIILIGGLLLEFCYLAIRYLIEKQHYLRTDYYRSMEIPYPKLHNDTGRYGEYETFITLCKLNGYKRFLFNCYIPRNDDDDISDTELDLIMLHPTGVYVFESKNYSGWIFGNENQRMWTQTLPTKDKTKRKYTFFNPMMQNALHIKWLSAYLADETLPFHSFVVFSRRCELKKITTETDTHHIVKRDALTDSVALYAHHQPVCLSAEQIDTLYETLKPLMHMDNKTIQAHISALEKKHK